MAMPFYVDVYSQICSVDCSTLFYLMRYTSWVVQRETDNTDNTEQILEEHFAISFSLKVLIGILTY